MQNLGVDRVETWLNDLKNTWVLILVIALVAAVIGFIYMLFMRYCAGVVVWVSILFLIFCIAFLGYLCY